MKPVELMNSSFRTGCRHFGEILLLSGCQETFNGLTRARPLIERLSGGERTVSNLSSGFCVMPRSPVRNLRLISSIWNWTAI